MITCADFDPFAKTAEVLNELKKGGASWRDIARQLAPRERADSVAPVLFQAARGSTRSLHAVELVTGQRWEKATIYFPVDGDTPDQVADYLIVPAVRTCPASGLQFVQGKAILYSPFATTTQRRDYRRERMKQPWSA